MNLGARIYAASLEGQRDAAEARARTGTATLEDYEYLYQDSVAELRRCYVAWSVLQVSAKRHRCRSNFVCAALSYPPDVELPSTLAFELKWLWGLAIGVRGEHHLLDRFALEPRERASAAVQLIAFGQGAAQDGALRTRSFAWTRESDGWAPSPVALRAAENAWVDRGLLSHFLGDTFTEQVCAVVGPDVSARLNGSTEANPEMTVADLSNALRAAPPYDWSQFRSIQVKDGG